MTICNTFNTNYGWKIAISAKHHSLFDLVQILFKFYSDHLHLITHLDQKILGGGGGLENK